MQKKMFAHRESPSICKSENLKLSTLYNGPFPEAFDTSAATTMGLRWKHLYMHTNPLRNPDHLYSQLGLDGQSCPRLNIKSH